MRNALDDLIRLIPPPAVPILATGPWVEHEAELGIRFPTDFKDMIRVYGSGLWGNFITYNIPFACSSPKQYHDHLENNILIWEREARENCPDEYAGLIFPEPGGRLPCGGTTNGDMLWWETKGDADSWPIIVWQTRGPDHEHFDVTFTELVYGWLTGRIRPTVTTDFFVKQAGPVFTQWKVQVSPAEP